MRRTSSTSNFGTWYPVRDYALVLLVAHRSLVRCQIQMQLLGAEKVLVTILADSPFDTLQLIHWVPNDLFGLGTILLHRAPHARFPWPPVLLRLASFLHMGTTKAAAPPALLVALKRIP